MILGGVWCESLLALLVLGVWEVTSSRAGTIVMYDSQTTALAAALTRLQGGSQDHLLRDKILQTAETADETSDDRKSRVALTVKLAVAASAARAKAATRLDVQQHASLHEYPAVVTNSSMVRVGVSDGKEATRTAENKKNTSAGAISAEASHHGSSGPRPLPAWWWWRQLQMQREKDDEFQRILAGKHSIESDEDDHQKFSRRVTVRNISAMSGRVLRSGQVVVGGGVKHAPVSANSSTPPLPDVSELACSVRVKRLRKFRRLEKCAPGIVGAGGIAWGQERVMVVGGKEG